MFKTPTWTIFCPFLLLDQLQSDTNSTGSEHIWFRCSQKWMGSKNLPSKRTAVRCGVKLTQSDAPMWWCSRVQRLQQVREKTGILLQQTHVNSYGQVTDSTKAQNVGWTLARYKTTDLEDVLQDVELVWGLVDADGASSNLTAIQYQVIVLTTDLGMTEQDL